MDYYLYGKPEVKQVEIKRPTTSTYILRALIILLFFASWAVNIIWFIAWIMWFDYPLWVDIATGCNLFLSLFLAELFGLLGGGKDDV